MSITVERLRSALKCRMDRAEARRDAACEVIKADLENECEQHPQRQQIDIAEAEIGVLTWVITLIEDLQV